MEEKVDGKAPRDSEKESDSGRIRRNAGLCERIIEPEPGRSRRNDVSCQARSASHKGPCFGVTIAAATRTAKGLAHLKNWQWKAVVEKKAHRGKLWRMLVKDQFIQGKWEYFSLERVKAKKVYEGCRERQAGRYTRPMATSVSCQRILPGTSKEWCGH